MVILTNLTRSVREILHQLKRDTSTIVPAVSYSCYIIVVTVSYSNTAVTVHYTCESKRQQADKYLTKTN